MKNEARRPPLRSEVVGVETDRKVLRNKLGVYIPQFKGKRKHFRKSDLGKMVEIEVFSCSCGPYGNDSGYMKYTGKLTANEHCHIWIDELYVGMFISELTDYAIRVVGLPGKQSNNQPAAITATA